MKRAELERRLRAAGCTLEHGSKHIKVRDCRGNYVLTLPANWKAEAADYHKKLRGQLRRLEADFATFSARL